MSYQSWPWAIIGAAISGAVLSIAAYTQLIKPWLRLRLLKHPCKAYFHIREFQVGRLDYVFQNDHAHNVNEIVLPANSLVEIEVAYIPRIRFSVEDTVFGINGDLDAKPLPEERITRFVADGKGKNHWIPGVDDTESIDRHGNYHHRSTSKARAVGSCYVTGYKVRTQKPGSYKAWLGFLTDEVDAEANLSIRVEERPSTKMKCVHPGHWRCTLKPLPKRLRSSEQV